MTPQDITKAQGKLILFLSNIDKAIKNMNEGTSISVIELDS